MRQPHLWVKKCKIFSSKSRIRVFVKSMTKREEKGKIDFILKTNQRWNTYFAMVFVSVHSRLDMFQSELLKESVHNSTWIEVTQFESRVASVIRMDRISVSESKVCRDSFYSIPWKAWHNYLMLNTRVSPTTDLTVVDSTDHVLTFFFYVRDSRFKDSPFVLFLLLSVSPGMMSFNW
jgi:hypothetical protein